MPLATPQTPQVQTTPLPMEPAGLPSPPTLAPQEGEEMVDTVTFVLPKIKGLYIDYCARYQEGGVPDEPRGIDCGVPAATLYCRSQGLAEAGDYIVTYYSTEATYTVGTNKINTADPPGYGKGRHTYFTQITCRMRPHMAIAEEEAPGVASTLAVVVARRGEGGR